MSGEVFSKEVKTLWRHLEEMPDIYKGMRCAGFALIAIQDKTSVFHQNPEEVLVPIRKDISEETMLDMVKTLLDNNSNASTPFGMQPVSNHETKDMPWTFNPNGILVKKQ